MTQNLHAQTHTQMNTHRTKAVGIKFTLTACMYSIMLCLLHSGAVIYSLQNADLLIENIYWRYTILNVPIKKKQPCGVNIIINSILHMKKLRLLD